MGKLDWLQPHLVPILQERPDYFWISYQVWKRLKATNPVVAKRLVDEYTEAVGRGGGAHTGPAWAISQCLGRWDQVEEHYLNAQGVRIDDVHASSDDRVAVFRLRR